MLYELCYPKKRTKELRIFNKNSHNCNIGNSNKINLSILKQLLTNLDSEYINFNNYEIYPDFSNDSKMNELWLKRCYENIQDIRNKKIIILGKDKYKEEVGGVWYCICIYDTNKQIYKFRSLLEWNKKQDYYKEKKCKKSIDDDYWIDYSNMESYKNWWIELKNRIDN